MIDHTKIPAVFNGFGLGSDGPLKFTVVLTEPSLVVRCDNLGEFWSDPSRSRNMEIGNLYNLRETGSPESPRWTFDDGHLPWFSFEIREGLGWITSH